MRDLSVKRVGLAAALVFVLAGVGRSGFATQTDTQLVSECRQTMALYKQKDPSLEGVLKQSVAYVVFPSVGKGGLGIGAAYGTGVLFEGGAPIGKVTLNQLSIGAQAGGQQFSEVIFYEVEKPVSELKSGKAELSGGLSAVALKKGAASSAQFKNGVAVFTAAKGGLMLEASIGGQKFDYTAF